MEIASDSLSQYRDYHNFNIGQCQADGRLEEAAVRESSYLSYLPNAGHKILFDRLDDCRPPVMCESVYRSSDFRANKSETLR